MASFSMAETAEIWGYNTDLKCHSIPKTSNWSNIRWNQVLSEAIESSLLLYDLLVPLMNFLVVCLERVAERKFVPKKQANMVVGLIWQAYSSHLVTGGQSN